MPFSRSTKRLVSIGLVIFFLLFLGRVGGLLVPFLWAVVMSYILNPLIGALCRRTRWRRGAVVPLVFLALLGALGLLATLAVPRINDEVLQLARDLPAIVDDIQQRYFGYDNLPLTIGPFNIDVSQAARQLSRALNGGLDGVFGGMFTVIKGTITQVTEFILFLIVTFYLLLDAPRIGPYFVQRIPARYKAEIVDLGKEVDRVLSHYVRAQLVLMGVMTVASLVVLATMGVRFAIILAPLVGVLEIFPVIGPFAAITLVTLVALFSPPNFGLSDTGSALVVALLFFILRQIEDYAVIPNVIGHAVQLHPVLILFAVAAGATLGGPLGLFVAVPLTGALKVVAHYLYQKLELDALAG